MGRTLVGDLDASLLVGSLELVSPEATGLREGLGRVRREDDWQRRLAAAEQARDDGNAASMFHH